MAYALLARQDETSWAHMGKIPYSNHHLNANPTNPNPTKKQKKFPNATGNVAVNRYHNNMDHPVVTQTASDDAYSFNQTSSSRNAANYGAYLRFNVASYSKSELLELRKRLLTELEQVRDLQERIVSSHYCSTENFRSSGKIKKKSGNRRPIAAFDSPPNRPDNDVFHNRCLDDVNFEALLKDCKQILTKLLKHKHSRIFKTPVDAAALGLHDYHFIVKRPMDLGTVKSNLTKNLYPSPVEFAADVRLTFNNALLYNPKTDLVHSMADQLLVRFEELFRPIQEKIVSYFNQQSQREVQEFRVNNEMQFQRNEDLRGNVLNPSFVSPSRGGKVKQKSNPVQNPQISKKLESMQMPMQAHSSASTPSHPPPQSHMDHHQPVQDPLQSPVRAPLLPNKDKKNMGGVLKLPKPKAKDLNKREMNMEEKQNLGIGLQCLPDEKMSQLVHIIRKRNAHLAQEGDEIELDIEALDTETLWDLDRFVMNCKKSTTKTKQQSEAICNDARTGVAAPSTPIHEADMCAMSEKNYESLTKLKDDDEDVDIDDDLPATSFPPVEIEKDEGVGIGQDSSSSSGGSSSDSSSSSDSDSGSSSGSDSDADDAQS